jgi:hypothetical protein
MWLPVAVLVMVPVALVVACTASDWFVVRPTVVEVELIEAVVRKSPTIELPDSLVVLVEVADVVAVADWLWSLEVSRAVDVARAVVVAV